MPFLSLALWQQAAILTLLLMLITFGAAYVLYSLRKSHNAFLWLGFIYLQSWGLAMLLLLVWAWPVHSPSGAVKCQVRVPVISDSPPPVRTKASDAATHPILEIFEPRDIENSTSLFQLKRAYEKTLSAAYILKRCDLAPPELIPAILTGLDTSVAPLSTAENGTLPLTAAEIKANIIAAAEGSHELFYQYISCNHPEIPALQTVMAQQWLTNISNTSQMPKDQPKN